MLRTILHPLTRPCRPAIVNYKPHLLLGESILAVNITTFLADIRPPPVFFPSHCSQYCTTVTDFQTPTPGYPDLSSGSAAGHWALVLESELRQSSKQLGLPAVARAQAVFATCLFDATSVFMPGWMPALATNLTKVQGLLAHQQLAALAT